MTEPLARWTCIVTLTRALLLSPRVRVCSASLRVSSLRWKVHHEGFSGKLGYIPSNYVKALVEVPAVSNPTTTILTAAGNVSVVADFEPSKERPLLVKASHAYKALANNQLSFAKGDLLHVFQKAKGWWKGQTSNATRLA